MVQLKYSSHVLLCHTQATDEPFSVQLSCYLGLMCSSCSRSKFRHLLPAPMDCMVGDDCHVRLCSSAEYGIGDSHPFILASPRCFAEDNRPLRHGSSFNKQKLWGGMIAIYIAHIFFLRLLLALLSFSRLMVLLISVLKCFLPVTLFQVLFLCFCFRLN